MTHWLPAVVDVASFCPRCDLKRRSDALLWLRSASASRATASQHSTRTLLLLLRGEPWRLPGRRCVLAERPLAVSRGALAGDFWRALPMHGPQRGPQPQLRSRRD